MSSTHSPTVMPPRLCERLGKRDQTLDEADAPNDSERALEALNRVGFDSVASLLDSLLESNSLDYTECRQMLLALLRYEKNHLLYIADQEFRREVSVHARQIAVNEMDVLVSHPALKLPVAQVNPETLDRFDTRAIAECQQTCAPMITSILRTCTGLKDTGQEAAGTGSPEEGEVDLEQGDAPTDTLPRGPDRRQIATVSLCMLSYARNQQSNLLQMTMGYFSYTDNATKQMMEILHRMGLLVTYETLRRALTINAEDLLSFDNTNVYDLLSFDNENAYDLLSFENMNVYDLLSLENMNVYEHRQNFLFKKHFLNHKSSNVETIAMNPWTGLATEMVIEIFSHLEPRDLKAVRLVCRRFETLASPRLFTKAYVAARRGVMDVFKQITSHPVLSTHIRELIYDASWFEPSVAASLKNFSQTSIARGVTYSTPPKARVVRRHYKTYVRLFKEQERILSDELPGALAIAFKVPRNIHRVTFADFSRKPYILGDRAKDFGNVFHSRCNSDSWIHHLTHGANLNIQRLPEKFGAFKLLMKALSASSSLGSVQCFSAGDGLWSSEDSSSSGIPHTFFSSRCQELPRGVFHGLRHLRKLDLSIFSMRTTAGEEGVVEIDAMKELLNMFDCLEELRLVLSTCPPPPKLPHKFASLSKALVGGSKTWKNLRTLELRSFELESSDMLKLLRRHRHCLRKIDIDEFVLLDAENWVSFCELVHVEYPNLHIASEPFRDGCQLTIVGTTDVPEGEAPPIDWAKARRKAASDDFDREVDWIFGDATGSYSDNESFTDNVSTTSEELEFDSGPDDDSDVDSLLGLQTS